MMTRKMRKNIYELDLTGTFNEIRSQLDIWTAECGKDAEIVVDDHDYQWYIRYSVTETDEERDLRLQSELREAEEKLARQAERRRMLDVEQYKALCQRLGVSSQL